MFDFLEYEKLNILDDIDLSREFIPQGLNYDTDLSVDFSLKADESLIAVKENDYSWILLKGGLNNEIKFLLDNSNSYKYDYNPLVIGLIDEETAIKEIHNNYIVKNAISIPNRLANVLYFKRYNDYELPKGYEYLNAPKNLKGEIFKPCILYTRVKSPFTISYFTWRFDDNERKEIINEYSKYLNINYNEFADTFVKIIAQNLGVMHRNGFINTPFDTDNVSILGEIISYKCIMTSNENVEEQSKQKIIEKDIYNAVSTTTHLQMVRDRMIECVDVYGIFEREYKKYNEEFSGSVHSIVKEYDAKRFKHQERGVKKIRGAK